jgi:hypothetical protein
MLPKRPSAMNLSAPMPMGAPLSPGSRPATTPDPDEFEGETLGERKRRLAAKEEAESRLPRARPVSTAFSAELLSQFGDLDEDKDKAAEKDSKVPPRPEGEEETLGQRRRRLQAEREARQREMSYGHLTNEQPPKLNHRLSMADVLSAHPKGAEAGVGGYVGEDQRIAREQEAKMAAMRQQMPTSLTGPTLGRSGGFQGGAFNDGNAGGQGLHAMRSQPNLNPYQAAPPLHRASTVFGTYAMPAQQPMYGNVNGVNGMMGVNGYNPYGASPMNMHNAGRMQPGMPMQMPMALNGASVDRVEQWRQGVWH